jgi:hypothetical protein
MRFVMTLATAFVATIGFILAGAAVAQQGGDAGDDDLVPKRLERAARVVTALEAAETRAKAASPIDVAYLKLISEALEDARAMTEPVTLAELTAEERKSLAEELKDAAGGGDGGGLNEWQQRALERAFEGTGLSEEEETKASPIIADWYAGFLDARASRDSKAQSDLKRQRDKDLTKALGKKKARKLINNLNAIGGRGR